MAIFGVISATREDRLGDGFADRAVTEGAMITTLFLATLLLATLLCALVAGFLFAFAVVVMPGIATLDDAGFLRGFQAIDRVIQRSQPLFMLVWVGSVLAVIAVAALSVWSVAGLDRVLVVVAALFYLAGVQVPTATINIPLNNQIETLDVAAMTDAARRDARERFERRWNQWNVFRTIIATLVTVLLLLALLRA
jgi:uncharacterized membrane protein